MTNPSPGLPHPVRRVIPDRRTGSELLRLPRTARRVSRTVQTNAASRPGLYQPVRRVILLPPLRERVPTASPTNAASSPASPNSAASFSGFPELSNQCGESSPDRQAMRRASPAFPNCPNLCGELFPPDCHIQCGESPHAPPNSGRESFVSPNFAANCAQNKNSTALTIGNEGI